jgi:hypothetical protein
MAAIEKPYSSINARWAIFVGGLPATDIEVRSMPVPPAPRNLGEHGDWRPDLEIRSQVPRRVTIAGQAGSAASRRQMLSAKACTSIELPERLYRSWRAQPRATSPARAG